MVPGGRWHCRAGVTVRNTRTTTAIAVCGGEGEPAVTAAGYRFSTAIETARVPGGCRQGPTHFLNKPLRYGMFPGYQNRTAGPAHNQLTSTKMLEPGAFRSALPLQERKEARQQGQRSHLFNWRQALPAKGQLQARPVPEDSSRTPGEKRWLPVEPGHEMLSAARRGGRQSGQHHGWINSREHGSGRGGPAGPGALYWKMPAR